MLGTLTVALDGKVLRKGTAASYSNEQLDTQGTVSFTLTWKTKAQLAKQAVHEAKANAPKLIKAKRGREDQSVGILRVHLRTAATEELMAALRETALTDTALLMDAKAGGKEGSCPLNTTKARPFDSDIELRGTFGEMLQTGLNLFLDRAGVSWRGWGHLPSNVLLPLDDLRYKTKVKFPVCYWDHALPAALQYVVLSAVGRAFCAAGYGPSDARQDDCGGLVAEGQAGCAAVGVALTRARP